MSTKSEGPGPPKEEPSQSPTSPAAEGGGDSRGQCHVPSLLPLPSESEPDRGASSRSCNIPLPGSADHGPPSPLGARHSASPPVSQPPLLNTPSTPLTPLPPPPDIPPNHIPDSEQELADDDLMPSHLVPLICCPLCPPSTRIRAPTTLHCGHTVCSHHVHGSAGSHDTAHPPAPEPTHAGPDAEPELPVLPACPLPTCAAADEASASSSRLHPNIPPTSAVIYRPAPPIAHAEVSVARIAEPKLDVTVAKVLDLVDRAAHWVEEDNERRAHGFVPTRNPEDGDSTSDEDPDEDPYPQEPRASTGTGPPRTPMPSHSRNRADSDSPSPSARPRKRRRKGPNPHSPPAAVAGGAGPSRGHTATSAFSAGGTYDEGSPPHVRFEKELMGELTCEICFMLLFQPVTSPCQHVCLRLLLAVIHRTISLRPRERP